MSAGEPSGDAHAAQVVRCLLASGAPIAVEGIGGPELERAGASLFARMEQLSVVGLAEALVTVPHHARLLRELARRIAARHYDALLLVDYPGLHLRVAARAAAAGIPVVYYIAPQVWAWGGWRLRALRRGLRHLAVVLPFEEAFFRARGIPATFVGHPLLDREDGPTRAAARSALGLPPDAAVLALFPGSRPAEIERLWPVFRSTAVRLSASRPDLEVLVAAGPLPDPPERVRLRFVRGGPALVLAAADAALCKSGTTTLEAALSGTPMVVAYRTHPVTFAIARRVVDLQWIGLVNLIANREIVPEFLQHHASPRALEQAVLPLLNPSSTESREQRAALAAVRTSLGTPGAAQRVARLTLDVAA